MAMDLWSAVLLALHQYRVTVEGHWKKQLVEAAAVVPISLDRRSLMTFSRAASRSARRNGGGGPQAARLAMEGLRARKRLALRRCKGAGVKSDSTQAEVGR